ncbi:GNAT family N-acetyltransferase [Candidatus Zixiibacteriota bacterium]
MKTNPPIELQPFTDADIDRLIGWIPSAEALLQWGGSGYKFPLDGKQIREHLSNASGENPKHLIFKAVDTERGRVVGHGEILAIDRVNRSAVLGRILVGSTEARGKGIGEQIVRQLVRIAFEDLSLHRVSLRVYDFNQAAIRCYEKAGFKREGLQRDVHRIGEKYWSVFTMSILEEE